MASNGRGEKSRGEMRLPVASTKGHQPRTEEQLGRSLGSPGLLCYLSVAPIVVDV